MRLPFWLLWGLVSVWALRAAAEPPVQLDVPFVKQEKNACGAASLAMLIQYWKQQGADVAAAAADPAAIRHAIYTPEARGIYASAMEQYVRTQGFQVFAFAGTWKDLTEHIGRGRPVVVALREGGHGSRAHYVVVAGLDEERDEVLLNDPARRKLSRERRRTFETEWRAAGYWALLAVPSPAVAAIRKLYEAGRWKKLLEEAAETAGPADLDYYRGMALARLKRWPEAHAAFEEGARKQPLDPRFQLQLAGVAYRQQDFRGARRALKRGLELGGDAGYANDFLGTLYFLDGNVEAALKYWNRVGRPRVRRVVTDPEPRLDAILLDRAFAFSPAGTLRAVEWLATSARLRQLDVFSRYRLELQDAEAEQFDVVFRGQEKNGWGAGRLGAAISLLRGLPFQQVQPEYHNLRGSAVNVVSMLRWDPNKRRVRAEVSMPAGGDPARRLSVYFDGRDENWDITRALRQGGDGGEFGLRKAETGIQFDEAVNGNWSWGAGLYFSHRRFSEVAPASKEEPLPASFLRNGSVLKYGAHLSRVLVRAPEHRFTLTATPAGQVARLFSGGGSFARAGAVLETRWFPHARGDDYETRFRVRAGKTWGKPPLDELYVLGVERDNDLWMRGHAGTHRGRKGSAPMGGDFMMASWETDKAIYEAGFVSLKAGPFVDTGVVRDRARVFGSRGWLTDAGARIRVRVLGSAGFVISYGRDLRRGGQVFFASVER